MFNPCCCTRFARVLHWFDNGGLVDDNQRNALNTGIPLHDGQLVRARNDSLLSTAPWNCINWGTSSWTLNDFDLVIWSQPESDPPWWSDIGSYTGRIVLNTDISPGSNTSISYMNGITGTTGMGVTGDDITGDEVLTNDLTDGCTALNMNRSSIITGGNAIIRKTTTHEILAAENRSGNVHWVYMGDQNWVALISTVPANNGLFGTFIDNLMYKD